MTVFVFVIIKRFLITKTKNFLGAVQKFAKTAYDVINKIVLPEHRSCLLAVPGERPVKRERGKARNKHKFNLSI
eukprot:2972942-Rhodomonas_salina.1